MANPFESALSVPPTGIPAAEKGAAGGVALDDLSNANAARLLNGEFVVGSRTSHYSGNPTYSSIRAGTTRSRHIIPVACQSLALVFSGIYNAVQGTGADGEIPLNNDNEIAATIEGPPIASGTATGGSGTTLVHSGAGWKTNRWKNFHVRNNATGGLAKITANDSTTLTVSTPVGTWTISNGQSYSIIRLALVRFDGRRLRLIKPGELVKSDPAFLPVAAGEEIWIRTYMSRLASAAYTVAGETGLLASAQSYWPGNRPARGVVGATGEGVVYTLSDGVDPSTVYYGEGGAIPATDITSYAPCAILGYTTKTASKAVAIIGDSISTPGYDSYESLASGFGIVHRALYGVRPMVNLGCGGEMTWNWNVGYAQIRRQMASWCDVAIVNFGSNDMANDGAVFATIQSRLQTLWASLGALGLKVYQCTILPRTTSTDGWKTTGNQTIYAATATWEAARTSLNDWIRTTPSPISGYFDAADAVETARNSGIWKAPGSAAATGAATGGSSTTLVDSGASWTTNQYAGYTVRNTTAGHIGFITSNTATTLNVTPVGSWSPTASDAYEILQALTADGTHPSGYGNALCAAKVVLP